MSAIIGMVLNWFGSGFLNNVLTYLEKRADSETERLRIKSVRDQALAATQASVITSGMAHTAFWIPWLTATCPLALWFAWGMLDTTFPGHLPHVATIPPGLENWAQVAWSNLFYSGGAVAGATIIGSAIARR